MRILVTGGAGFIGSNFVRYILDEQTDEVVNLDSLAYAGSKQNLEGVLEHPRHDFIEGDIRNEELVSSLVSDVDIIVNFAAESHVDRSIEGASSFVDANVKGVQVLLDAAVDSGIERFIQISTDEVYGEITEGSFSEDHPLQPRNPYAATKASADLLVQSYQITHDLPAIITRSSNNYGPRQNEEKLIPKFITRALRDESLPIYGDGTNVREWTYVLDNCRAIYKVLKKGKNGEIYNIGSGKELSNIEVTKKILEHLDKPEELIEFVDDRAGHDQRYALDTTKIEALGWEPEWTFDEGLEQTIKSIKMRLNNSASDVGPDEVI